MAVARRGGARPLVAVVVSGGSQGFAGDWQNFPPRRRQAAVEGAFGGSGSIGAGRARFFKKKILHFLVNFRMAPVRKDDTEARSVG